MEFTIRLLNKNMAKITDESSLSSLYVFCLVSNVLTFLQNRLFLQQFKVVGQDWATELNWRFVAQLSRRYRAPLYLLPQHTHSLFHYEHPSPCGTCVIINTPTLPCHNHPKSTAALKFTLHVVYSMKEIENVGHLVTSNPLWSHGL